MTIYIVDMGAAPRAIELLYGDSYDFIIIDELATTNLQMGHLARITIGAPPSPKLQALRNRLALAKTQRNKVLIRDLEKQIGALS